MSERGGASPQPRRSPSVWRIIPLLSIGSLLVLAMRAWLGEDALVFDVPVELAADAIPPLAIDTGARASGVVVDGGDAPLPGALIAVVSDGRPRWTHTADDGSFELDELAPGEHDFHLLARGYVPAIARASVPAEALRLVVPELVRAPPRLDPYPASDLAGRVTRNGPPVSLEGYRLALVPLVPPDEPGRAVPRWELLATDGSFAVRELAHASYRAMLLPPWAGESFWPDLLAPLDETGVRRIEHPSGAPAVHLEVQAGAIVGAIRRADPSGPVHGALLFAVPEPPLRPAREFGPVTTGADGSFRFDDLPPATYRVRALVGSAARERVVTVGARAESQVDFGPFE